MTDHLNLDEELTPGGPSRGGDVQHGNYWFATVIRVTLNAGMTDGSLKDCCNRLYDQLKADGWKGLDVTPGEPVKADSDSVNEVRVVISTQAADMAGVGQNELQAVADALRTINCTTWQSVEIVSTNGTFATPDEFLTDFISYRMVRTS